MIPSEFGLNFQGVRLNQPGVPLGINPMGRVMGGGGDMGQFNPNNRQTVNVVPALDSRRQQPQGALNYSKGQAFKDAIMPALAGALAGPAGAAAGAIFGIMTASDKYRMSKDPLAQARYNAELAATQYAAANPGVAAAGSMPSSIQEWNAFQQMSPEEQRAYLGMKAPGATSPKFFNDGENVWAVDPITREPYVVERVPGRMAPGVVDARVSEAGRSAGAAEGARLDQQLDRTPELADADSRRAAASTAADKVSAGNEEAYAAGNAVLSSLDAAEAELDELEAILEQTATGWTTEVTGLFDGRVQNMRAAVAESVLGNIRAGKQAGMAAPNSDTELGFLKDIGVKPTNTYEANAAILARSRRKVQRQRAETERRLRGLPPMGVPQRPEIRGAPPAPASAPTRIRIDADGNVIQ